MENKIVTITIVGCGNRGGVYASFSKLCPNSCKVVGICEPRKEVRDHMAQLYGLTENIYEGWEELAKVNTKISDAIVICTQDKFHTGPAIAFANLGYDILLEKPMATTREECIAIEEAVSRNKVIFAVGHVLRYMPYSVLLKKLVDQEIIGDIINIQHLEPVGWYHFAHSYVRGNWHNSQQSSFSLLAKSCHDIDWISWVINKKCTKISSFGSLKHFTQQQKPANATSRCLDCPLSSICAYSADKIYLEPLRNGELKFPATHLNLIEPTIESVTQSLKTSDYGRCVYDMDNDVMDNQVVNMQFDGGATASFTMIAFSKEICVRKTRIFGTRGEIEGDGEHVIKVFDFATRTSTSYDSREAKEIKQYNDSGHGGGDFGLMGAFVNAVATRDQSLICDVKTTLSSHLMVFDAEKSRVDGKVIDLTW